MQTMPGLIPGYFPEADTRDMLVGVNVLFLPIVNKPTLFILDLIKISKKFIVQD